jgi:TRAP-type mannitol/chloroaromatic compound transport system permease small subunit
MSAEDPMAAEKSTDERTAGSSGGGGLDRLLDRLAGAISWIWLALIAVIVASVVLRFGFGGGRVELEELQWHLYAAGFLVGIVGCARHDRHVRVDVLRERMPPRNRAWVDLYGILLLQLPFVALVLWSAWPLVVASFETGERSDAAGGLPHRWILKAALPLAFGLLALATASRLRQLGRTLFGGGMGPTGPTSPTNPTSSRP